MSVENTVFMEKGKLPSPQEWLDAIRSNGFEMDMDTDFDPITHEGYIPCKYKGKDAGFEYWAEEVDFNEFLEEGTLTREEADELGDRSFMVTLVTRGDFRELITAMIAAAVLCEMTDGLYAEGGAPPFITADNAVKRVKKYLPELEKETKKMTLGRLKKLAKDDLIPFLQEKGFRIVNTLTFLKEGPEEIYYVIYPELSYGENLKVWVVCHTAEMQELIGDEFPSYIAKLVGGKLEPGEPVYPTNGYIWEVGTEEQAKQALKEIRSCIEESALPFFESITDRQKLVDFIHPVLRRDCYADVVEKILAWKPKE